jgi:hypothetical protein
VPRVCWSEEARVDLVNVVIDSDMIDQLIDNAETTLHQVTVATADEGVKGPTMWHRGFTHDQESQINAGTLPEGPPPQPWDYFFFYQHQGGSGCEFTVVSVVSTSQMAARYQR